MAIRDSDSPTTVGWHCPADDVAPPLLAQIAAALDDHGFRLRADAEADATARIVAFAQLNEAVIEATRDACAVGARRVVALAVSPGGPLGLAETQALLKAGAADATSWRGVESARQLAARLARWESVDAVLRSALVAQNLVGRSSAWTAALREVVDAALWTDAPLLITGESGTGKELMARLAHTVDRRPSKGDLVIVDCTTVVPELAGSEFCGHERGAFTGAQGPRDGAFALAHRGTLFLDEIGDLPLPLQAQLLRVVQEHTYKRVGGNTWQTSEFRLVCATNRDLLGEVDAGRFRRDLYYRLAGVVCELPPLRARRDDILLLAQHFLQRVRPDQAAPELDDPLRLHLLTREYPGNVRDLHQLVRRLSYRHAGAGPISLGDLPPQEHERLTEAPSSWLDSGFESAIKCALEGGVGLKDITRAAASIAIRVALAAEAGNLRRAAQRLGVTDRALQLRRAHGQRRAVE